MYVKQNDEMNALKSIVDNRVKNSLDGVDKEELKKISDLMSKIHD